jgi:hypothetical protein
MSGIPIGVRLGKPRVEQNESALPQIADKKATLREVCVGPIETHGPQQITILIDHPVSAG